MSNVVQEVEDGNVWATVYMNPGVTVGIKQVIDSIVNGYNISKSSYIPASAVTIVYDEGRNVNNVNGFTLPAIRAAIATASSRYSTYVSSQIQSFTNVTSNSVIAAVALSNITSAPISFTSNNLHPALPYARALATSLGYMFLWLLMTSVVTVSIAITKPLIERIKLIDIVILRIINSAFHSFIISLIFSLCVFWFGQFREPGRFIQFWLFNWLASLAFASIIALFTLNLGVLANVVLSIFLIINLSSSGSGLAIEVQATFYRIGYGLPLFHCFSAGRYFLFGSHTKLGVDIGTLVAYYSFCIILTIITGTIHMAHQQKKSIKSQKEEILNTYWTLAARTKPITKNYVPAYEQS